MKLRDIFAPISRELRQTNREIGVQLGRIHETCTPEQRRVVRRTVQHLFVVSGKLLRPALVLLCAKAADAATASSTNTAARDRKHSRAAESIYPQLIKIAAAVELVHSASLIHDDVIDEAAVRRNQRSVNAAHGNKIAVLVGDLLYAQLFTILKDLVEIDRETQWRLFSLFCATTQKMCMGEIYEGDIKRTGREATFEEYMQIIEFKTASLMAVCGQASAVLVGAEEKVFEALSTFGLNLGRSYQLLDDIVDEDSVFSSGQYMRQKAIKFGQEAKRALEPLGSSPFTIRLSSLVDFVFERVGGSKAESNTAELRIETLG
jgi:geranylgeranyl pyrophosphate synthase